MNLVECLNTFKSRISVFPFLLFVYHTDDFICLGFIVGPTNSSELPNTAKENTEKTYSNSSTKEETVKDSAHSEVTPTDFASTIILNRSQSNENSKYLYQTSGIFFQFSC